MRICACFAFCAVCLFWLAPALVYAEPSSGSDATAAYTNLRDGLDNCRLVFTHEKHGRVVFMGGSITTMSGWRELACDHLRKRFPGTEFDFIDAGIGGTNSTLGAFRLETDVFKNGPVDLLFLEFAVNDDGPETAGNRYSRAMEGIIRHARRLNPRLDILIQYFIDAGKFEAISKGGMPEVIAGHDKVAAHYGIPIINLAQEMTRRLNAKEFTWDQFARDTCHPLPFGHQQYMGCIELFLNAAWSRPAGADAQPVEHPLPAPLDAMNYEQGRFIALDEARVVEGWNRNRQWDTEKKCNYGGPVDVLAAETPGATLELDFEGSVIGISAIAGMDAGVLECRIDGGAPQIMDMFDSYCPAFHRPVCRIVAEDLAPGKHRLQLRMSDQKNDKSVGHAARILRFVAN